MKPYKIKHHLVYATDEQSEEIKSLRKQLEITQYDLFLYSGVSNRVISVCERYPYRVKKNTADRILDALHKLLAERTQKENELKLLYSQA